jgi:membrane-associated phospholipid phosphatase
MEKKIATFLTVLLHPLLAPIAGIFILTRSGTYIADLNPEIINLINLIVITLTLVLPVCMIPFYLYFRMIRQISIPEKHERLIPMIITLVAYLGAWFLIRRLPVSQLYGRFLLGACLSLLIVVAVSFYWKISLHMTGMGGLVGLVLALSRKLGVELMVVLLLLIILSGLAGFARLQLNAHSKSQVLAGFLIGLTVVYFLILV